ncbi:hypothetical protein TWF718_008036 [Orbilia javanica]|uniref:DNA mismatch repair protein S5 domain-containing protein n=1 Tax=Orbilia javanica TaxID=47235 RepID=A0AAN8RC47_9PEZI
MIHEIPQESVRRLGSTQVITDPITVIKELLENALDAGATSIVVEASSDLVSHIQVKDNGCGIDPNDRNLMAKPHCTSKISTFDDLLDVTTLGFRGEALASLANVSGLLTITTRIKNEAMAVACEIAPDGSLKTISPVSAPIGSTVKVTNLFAKFPVRKSTLEKTASKYLGQIKPLLLSYYLTHPQARLQFKCVAPPQGNKGKKKIETKYDVIFAASNTKEQAVIKALGAESSRHGQWIKIEEDNSDVHVEAFVVKPDADTNPTAKRGVCIAYKNRPLSISRNRGLAHSIYSLYKKQIKLVFAARSIDAPTEPFLFLNILSSTGKVDVNIEPAKDDVLFESNDRVIECIKQCFERAYGATEDTDETRKSGNGFSSEITYCSVAPSETPIDRTPQKALQSMPRIITTREQPFPETENHMPSSPPPIRTGSSAGNDQNGKVFNQGQLMLGGQEEGIPLPDRENSEDKSDAGQKDGWSFSMYGSGIDEEEDESFVDIEETLSRTEGRQAAREEDTYGDKSISNPWTISKMNSRVSQQEKQTHLPRSGFTTNSTITPLPASPLQTQGRGKQAHSPRAASALEIARPSREPIAVNTSTPSAPIAPMPGSKDPWYPRFGSGDTSSPNRRQERPSPRRLSEFHDTSSSPARQQSTRLPNTQKPGRKSAGLIGAWIGVNKATEASRTSPPTESDHESDIRLPISAFFGTPDLGSSNKSGDGGRGIFPSASDRMRRERRALNPQIDEEWEEDVSSSSGDDEPPQLDARPHKNVRSSASKLSIPAGQSKPVKLPCAPNIFNKPFKPHPGASRYPKDIEEDVQQPRKMKLLVATLPHIGLHSLQFRARLIQDDLYSDEYETGRKCLGDSALKEPFFCFLKRYVDGIDYSDDTELELLQEDILDGKEFEVSFQNLEGRKCAAP